MHSIVEKSSYKKKQGPQDAKRQLFHAFQKAVPTSDGVHEVAGASSGGSI